MVDYFSAEEMLGLHYLVISGGIQRKGIQYDGWGQNTGKDVQIRPTTELISLYANHEISPESLKKAYFQILEDYEVNIYHNILMPIMEHRHNVVLVCQKEEDFYIDLLCEFLSEKYFINTIDLNKLFEEGECELFYIDRPKTHNAMVPVLRRSTREVFESKASTRSGRLDLLETKMSRKTMIMKLKELGIKVAKDISKEEAKELLMEAWVED